IGQLPEDQPVFGISGADFATLPVPFRLSDIAARQIAAIQDLKPEGPYTLAGWCADGVLAYEVAQQLVAQGQSAPMILLFDSFNPARWSGMDRWIARQYRLRFHLAAVAAMSPGQAWGYARERWGDLRNKLRRRKWRADYRLRVRTQQPIEPEARVS